MTNLVKSSFITDEQIRRFLTTDELLNEMSKTESAQLVSVQKKLEALRIDLVGFCFDPIAARYVNRFEKIGELFYLVTPALDIAECNIINPYTKVLGNRSFLTLQIASTEAVNKVLSENGPVPKNLLTLDIPWNNYTVAHIARSVGWMSIKEAFEKSYHEYLRAIFKGTINYEVLLDLSDCLYQYNYYEEEF